MFFITRVVFLVILFQHFPYFNYVYSFAFNGILAALRVIIPHRLRHCYVRRSNKVVILTTFSDWGSRMTEFLTCTF